MAEKCISKIAFLGEEYLIKDSEAVATVTTPESSGLTITQTERTVPINEREDLFFVIDGGTVDDLSEEDM